MCLKCYYYNVDAGCVFSYVTTFLSFLGIILCLGSSCPKASSDFINLLDGLLQKDPQKRYVWVIF